MIDKDPPPQITARNLTEWGVEQNFYIANKVLVLTLIVLALTGIATAVYFFWTKRKPNNGNGLGGSQPRKTAEVAAFFFTIGTLFVGYVQWRDARLEASLKEFYERLDNANRRWERIYDDKGKRDQDAKGQPHQQGSALPEEFADKAARQRYNFGRWEQMDKEGGIHPVAMHFYVEMDNLEYMLKKFQFGYTDKDLAIRALITFRSRCFHYPVFVVLANDITKNSESGYEKVTRKVVENICYLRSPG